LAWYYLNVFCAIRIIGGALGIHDSNSMAANVISTVGISPLGLTIDGLLHEVYLILFIDHPVMSRHP
jgi:hypothetical protein